jgi:phage gp29-like protein
VSEATRTPRPSLWSRIVNAINPPPPDGANDTPLYEKSFVDRLLVSTGREFTPQDLLGYIHRAEIGDMRWLLAFYDEMRVRDAHLEAELAKATRRISGARLDILPYPANVRTFSNSKTRDAQQAADVASYLQEQLFSPDVRLDRVIATLCGGFWKGLAGLQVQAKPGGDQLVSITEIPAQRFRYWSGTTNLGLQVTKDQGVLEPVEPFMADGRLVLFMPDGTNPNPARMGLLRRCIPAWIGRNQGFKWWTLYVQLFGIPFRQGTYKTGNDDSKATIVAALENAGVAGWAALPEGNKIDFISAIQRSGGSESEHQRFLDYCAREESKVINGATQTTDVQKGSGSRATSGVHQDEAVLLATSRATEIAGVVRSQIMRPLVTARFGPDVAARFTSELRIRIDEGDDLLTFSETLVNLRKAGVDTIPVSYVHDKGSIPTPDPGEPTLGAANADAEEEPGMPGEAPNAPTPEDEAAVVAAAARILAFRVKRQTPEQANKQIDAMAARASKGAGTPLLAKYVHLIEQVQKDGGDLGHLAARVRLQARMANEGKQETADAIAAVLAEALAHGFDAEAKA